MQEVNVGTFMFNVMQSLMKFATTLYEVFTTEVDLTWLGKILGFFGVNSLNIPNSISLMWILGSASAIVLLGFIIYNIFKL